MACTDPGSISPGYLRLDYVHSTQSIAHGTRARLLRGVDPTDIVTMTALALDWANVWKGVVTNSFVTGGFSVLRHDGTLLYSSSFVTPTVGAHVSAAGAGDYVSRTLCFTGRGIPDTAVECSGEEIGRLFVGSAFEFVARQKYMVPGADSGVDAYAAFLATNSIFWGDEFGQKAGVRPRYPVQFNAYAQRRNGT